jgi:hypothetical protein
MGQIRSPQLSTYPHHGRHPKRGIVSLQLLLEEDGTVKEVSLSKAMGLGVDEKAIAKALSEKFPIPQQLRQQPRRYANLDFDFSLD